MAFNEWAVLLSVCMFKNYFFEKFVHYMTEFKKEKANKGWGYSFGKNDVLALVNTEGWVIGLMKK